MRLRALLQTQVEPTSALSQPFFSVSRRLRLAWHPFYWASNLKQPKTPASSTKPLSLIKVTRCPHKTTPHIETHTQACAEGALARLYCGWWFGCHRVANPRDPGNLSSYAVTDFLQHVIWKPCPVRSHTVQGFDDSDRDHIA